MPPGEFGNHQSDSPAVYSEMPLMGISCQGIDLILINKKPILPELTFRNECVGIIESGVIYYDIRLSQILFSPVKEFRYVAGLKRSASHKWHTPPESLIVSATHSAD